jgi:hypothetical protein
LQFSQNNWLFQRIIIFPSNKVRRFCGKLANNHYSPMKMSNFEKWTGTINGRRIEISKKISNWSRQEKTRTQEIQLNPLLKIGWSDLFQFKKYQIYWELSQQTLKYQNEKVLNFRRKDWWRKQKWLRKCYNESF